MTAQQQQFFVVKNGQHYRVARGCSICGRGISTRDFSYDPRERPLTCKKCRFKLYYKGKEKQK